MHTITIYRVTIKIIGLFLLKAAVETAPYIFSQLMHTFMAADDRPQIETMESLLLIIGFLFFFITAIYFALFKTNAVMLRLRLQEDAAIGNDLLETENSQNPLVSAAAKQVLMMVVLITAAIVLINEIPTFVNATYNFIKSRNDSFTNNQFELMDIILPGIKLIFAFLLFGERHRLVKWLEKNS
jgi:Na+/proline symporter